MTSGGSNFNDFPENQLTKVRPVQTVLRQSLFCDIEMKKNMYFIFILGGSATPLHSNSLF